MEAIVLAGGFGKRLRKVVADVPKPMAPIAGRPFLEILLSALAEKGFTRIVISLGFMAEIITSHFGKRYAGMDLVYVVEDIPLGTGGAARLAVAACTSDHVYIFNGDTYLDLDVEALEQLWRVKRQIIVVGRHVLDTTRYGRMVVKGGQITTFTEKSVAGAGLVNAGCYVLPSCALNRFPLYFPFSIESDFLSKEVISGKICVFVSKGLFIDIGVPEDYDRAQSLLTSI